MDKFDKKLTNKILPKFQNAKEWSDLMTVLKKLRVNIDKYSTTNMYNLTDKVSLSKRLAQSLNNILPSGVHEIALEIYAKLFENIKKNNNNYLGEDLGLYSSGLFPFFTYASIQNKFKYLNEIIKEHFLTLVDYEFNLCLPGMVVSIIPGLEEQNEPLQKTIKEIFGESRKKVSDSTFYGILWSIILRNQRLRNVCIKYINDTVPIYKSIEENPETKEEVVNNYYPNISILVVNSLRVLIEESDLPSQRVGMDFIITRFPIYNNILTEEDKILLLISGLQLLIKNDYSTTRRLQMWLMGPGQEDELEMGDPNIKYMIELLIKAIKKIFLSSETIGKKENLSNGIKIIDQLFKQQVKLVDYILEFVSIDMISAIELNWQNINHNPQDDIIARVKSFYSYDPGYLDCLWNSLGKKLNLITSSHIEEEDNSQFNDEMDIIVRTLKFCLDYVYLEKIDKKIKFYIPIISSLLKGLLLYHVDTTDDLFEVKPLIVLALKFVKSLQLGTQLEENSTNNSNSRSVVSKDNHYVPFASSIKFSCQKGNSLQFILKENQQNVSLIEILMENISLYQQVYITICQVLFKEDTEITRDIIHIFKEATELALLIQEYVSQDTIPEWLIYLEKIIFSSNIDLSLEGIFYLLDLFMITSENPIYDNIKNFLRTEAVSETIIDEKLLKLLIFQTHVSRNCIELSMARLWILLEEQNHQKPVTDLLIKFYTAEQNVFQNTISNTFAINDLTQNVNAIKKFSQFWKLTSEFYPDLIFFENGECIFKMLDFLDNENPLLRHLSKSWLSEAKNQFRKILDPLLKVLLDRETSWYISFQKQLYFTKEYDNRRIIEAFRKLKNIIINVPDIAINYFVSQPITQSLLDMDDIGKELRSVSKTISMEHYLELLVSISLRFIQGKFIESVSVSFYRENFSVNAASCEFLEFLLSFIEPKSKVMNIAQIISEPVLNILQESLMTNDEVMQVQLLNLLKVLLLNTKEEHQNFKQDAINIFNSKKFHECIVSGIQINYIFVRGYFINFVESCLPIFSNILDQDSNLAIAKRLIHTTTDFLVSRVKYNFLASKTNKLNSMELEEGDNYFIIKNFIDKYKDYKKLDENDLNVITKGLKNILFHFLKIDNSDKINWDVLKKQITSSRTGGSFSFFGLFKGGSSQESQDKKGEIKYEIIEILQDVFASFCTCWINNSDSYMSKDFCLNEHGLLGNSYEDMTFNENINTISLFKKQKQNRQLKDQIIFILQNIFYKNPFDFMKNFINLWQDEKNRYISKDKQYKLSLIEMLVALEIPVEIVLMSINKNIDIAKIKEIKKSKVRVKDIYPFYLNKEQSTYEAKLCHLVYSYINYNIHLRVDKNLPDIWNEMLSFISVLSDSKATNTICWLYEIINLLLFKLPLKDTVSDNSIKKKLSLIVISLFNRMLDSCIINKSDSVFEEPTQIVTPLPPSFYEKVAYQLYGNKISTIITEHQHINDLKIQRKKKPKVEEIKQEEIPQEQIQNESIEINIEAKKEEKPAVQNEDNTNPIEEFYKQVNEDIEKNKVIKVEELSVIYRNIGFITLKSLFYTTIKNIFSQEKMVPYFQLLVKNLLSIMNEKVIFNKIYVELSTEFLHSLISNASVTCTYCKQMILDFFLEPEFFNMSRYCLRLWKDIISEFAHSYQDIIKDLMDKMNQGGFFTKNTDQFNIKAMRRISFIIYSCPKDTFSTKLVLILEKVKEMITKYSENPTLEAEIFLMLRIMFLRFSHESLIEMIRALWPIIFSEIINVINNKRKNTSLDLNLSSMKLVELLSVANMDEFCLYQWIFFIDTFKVNEMDIENEQSELNTILHSDSLAFKPFAMGMAKNWERCKKLIEKYNKMKSEDFEKRSLLIQLQKVVSQDDLSTLISKVFVYIGIMNNFRNIVDLDAIEEVIENDFLNSTS